MKTTTIIVGALLLMATVMPTTVTAQQQSSQTTVEQELHSIGLRTGKVVKLLEELVAQRAEEQRLKRLQIAVLVLQLRSTVIAGIEDRIRTLGDRAEAEQARATQLEAEIQRVNERALDDSIKGPMRKRLENSKNQLEDQLEIATQRAWSFEKQILNLQNELSEKRRNVEALEEIVMEGLNNL